MLAKVLGQTTFSVVGGLRLKGTTDMEMKKAYKRAASWLSLELVLVQNTKPFHSYKKQLYSLVYLQASPLNPIVELANNQPYSLRPLTKFLSSLHTILILSK